MPRVFINYRREDCAAVAARLCDRLNQRFGATNVFRDIDAIDAGAQFAGVIAERIRTCDALIALIGKNWLDARDVEGRRRLDQPRDFVAVEISEALAQGKLVIPALIEGAPMPTREALPPHMASLADRQAIPIGDSRFDYDVGRLIGVIEKVIPPQSPAGVESGLTGRELRNRRDLLNDVKGEVANRLAQSLHSAVLINLQKEKQPQQVSRTGDWAVKAGHQPSTPLPPGTQIIDVFDQDAGRLLVLGAPGAGKTTTLLQLAKELIARAETDAGAPMPVLLNLSSWKDDNQPLAHWLEAELKSKYGLRKDIGRRWLHDRCLLPLLDGLDELEPAHQGKCVQAINQFQQDYRPDHLVVCCRLAEYQNCNTKLQLNGAIYLQPLTDEQVLEVPAPVSDASQAIDRVNFSVFAPGVIRPAQEFLLDLWVHLPTQTEEVTSLTREFARDRRLGVKPRVAVAHGAALSVVLDLPSLRIKDPSSTIFWNGEPDYASFVVEVPADVAIGDHPGRVIITASGIPIAKVIFCLPVEAEGTRVEKASRELPTVRRQPHSAFASFSGRDRKDVLGRVQGMTKVCQDLDVFVDVLSLRSGQDWEAHIRQQIPARDVFFLFWSFHASRSKEVEKEWRIALEMRGLDFIDPIPLNDPRVSPPPKELARLHFNDLYIAQIQMEESLKKLRKRCWWEFWRPLN